MGFELAYLSGAFALCAVGGIVPLLNSELLLLAFAAKVPAELLWPLVFLSSAGAMTGKTAVYMAGRGALKLKIRGRDRVDRFLAGLQERQGLTGSMLFVSAVSGLPPFYVVTVASGAAGLALNRFLVMGFAGLVLRFAAVAFAPQLVMGWLR